VSAVGPIPAVEMVGISKRFGGVHALRSVDFSVAAGEVHALVGENGAGKSTILKILEGVHVPDEGTINVFGEQVRAHSPQEAQRLGIAMIFQELSLVPTLTVAQNILLNREPRKGSGLLDDREANRQVRRLCRDLGIDLDPRAKVEHLSMGQRQLVEVVKALAKDARLLILDEPTSALSGHETDILFSIIDRLKSRGVSIVYVSHRMEEIFDVADRITVLRDGQHIVTDTLENLGIEGVIHAIVGRGVTAFEWLERTVDRSGAPLLQVRDLVGEDKPRGVSFDLHAGEILGFAGLMGAGRSETARALCGLDPVKGGTVELKGVAVDVSSAATSIEAGLAMIPEDRAQQGLVAQHSVADNLTLPVIRQLTRRGRIDQRRRRRLVDDLVARMRIKTADVDEPVRQLSGGNQQKVVIAKWLAATPEVLVLDEPTAGVDIGSKAEIVQLVRELADNGRGVILISSELPELLALSDRILVFDAGRIRQEVDPARIIAELPDDAEVGSQIAMAEQALQLLLQKAPADV
jgi:ribose transport system ATP-binding protein